ncbi:hypothetical protein ABK040_016834 [Willaertia magna]
MVRAALLGYTGGKDEDYDCGQKDNHAYGKNRLYLEKFIAETFANHFLSFDFLHYFGPRLAKNYIYDLMHNNNLNQINPNTSFQWYNVERMWSDIQTVLKYNEEHKGSEVRLLNLFPEPLHTSAFVKALFADKADQLKNPIDENKIDFSYDLYTKYGKTLFNNENPHYIDTAQNVLQQIISYVKKEQQQ